MVGRNVQFNTNKEDLKPGKIVLNVIGLSGSSSEEGSNINDVNCTIREREILGVAAISGNGQQSLVDTLIGTSVSKGQILVNGTDIINLSIHERRKYLSFVSEDRKNTSSSQQDNLKMNIFMTHHYLDSIFLDKHNILNHKLIKEFANKILRDFQVNTDDSNSSMSSLSGGNQQKVILGREIELKRPLLIVDEPVRGLDVGSIEYVHKRIVNERDSGKAVLLISSDLDEIINLSDRVIVFRNGNLVKELVTKSTSKEEIGEYMLGAKS